MASSITSRGLFHKLLWPPPVALPSQVAAVSSSVIDADALLPLLVWTVVHTHLPRGTHSLTHVEPSKARMAHGPHGSEEPHGAIIGSQVRCHPENFSSSSASTFWRKSFVQSSDTHPSIDFVQCAINSKLCTL